MKNKIFEFVGHIDYIPQEEYDQLLQANALLDAYSRMTYCSLYIVDYYREGFAYVSDNPLFLCGNTADEIKEMGFDFYSRHVTAEDLPLMKEASRAAYDFYKRLGSTEERQNYVLSYDIHIQQAPGHPKNLVNHQFTPLAFRPDGKIWLALCLASLSSHFDSGTINMFHKGKTDFWRYDLKNKLWRIVPGIILKEEEKEVVKLSAQGYSIAEMADRMNKSFDTIKSYRKSLFRKLDVDNISEAVSRSVTKRLI